MPGVDRPLTTSSVANPEAIVSEFHLATVDQSVDVSSDRSTANPSHVRRISGWGGRGVGEREGSAGRPGRGQAFMRS